MDVTLYPNGGESVARTEFGSTGARPFQTVVVERADAKLTVFVTREHAALITELANELLVAVAMVSDRPLAQEAA